jgi:hypothetical protein
MRTRHCFRAVSSGSGMALSTLVRLWKHFYKPFVETCLGDLVAFAVTSSALGRRCPLRMLSVLEVGKRGRRQVRRIWRILQSCHMVLDEVLFDHQRPMCRLVVVDKKPNHSCPLFRTFRSQCDCLCSLVVTVLGYRSGGPGSIPATTRKKSNESGTGSTQPREYN